MIIRLNQEDGINDYLEIDENIFSKDSENSYNDEPIYILHKPIKNTLISYGKGIEIINEYDIKHKCSTLNGSSGGPILNQITHKVLGIHKGFIKKKEENFNIGTFLKYPLNQILLIYVTKNINIKNNKNEENNKNNINKNTESNIKEYSNNNNISNSSNKKKPKFFSPKFYESLKRIKEEYKELYYNPNSNIGLSVGLFEDGNYFEWRITIIGGKDTPYEGGLFFLKLLLPEDYPNNPPKILFLTPIYHINIPSIKNNYFEIGNISADFLFGWHPDRTIKEVLIKLFSIFYLSNIDCEGCKIWKKKELIDEYINNYSLYLKKAKYFTKKYANFHQKFNTKDKEWDFSFKEEDINLNEIPKKKEITKNSNNYEKEDNSEIILIISYNGKWKSHIQCR